MLCVLVGAFACNFASCVTMACALRRLVSSRRMRLKFCNYYVHYVHYVTIPTSRLRSKTLEPRWVSTFLGE